jgi:hypothetical protein
MSSGNTPASRPPSDEADSIDFSFEPVEIHEGARPRERKHSAPPPSQPSRGAAGRVVRWLIFPGLLLPSLAALAWMAPTVVDRVEAGLRFPYQLDAEEGFLHQQAIDLSRGRSIYTPIESEPYLVGNYPPVYPLMVAGLLRGGVEGLRAGRLVVAGSAVVVALLLIGLGQGVSGRWTAGLLAALLFGVSYEFHNWSPFCRVDLTALALTLAGLFCFLTGASRGALVASAVLFVLAAYTRQTAILAPAACAAELALRDRRGLVWFLATYLGLGLGALVVLNVLLGGEFWRHLVTHNRNEMDWSILRSILKNQVWFFYRWWLVAAAAGVAFALPSAWAGRGGEERDGIPGGRAAGFVLAAYFALAAVSLSAYAKSGSAPNYSLEPLAATALLTAWALGRMAQGLESGSAVVRGWSGVGVALAALALLAHAGRIAPISWGEQLPDGERVQALAAYLDERRVGWAMFSSPNPDADEVARGDAVVAMLREAPGDVLSELPIFTIAAGKPVSLQPFIMSRLAREGQWDETRLVEDLKRGRFSVILTTQDLRDVRRGVPLTRYTPAMAEAVTENYALAGGFPPGALRTPFFIWRPNEGAGGP